MFFNPSKVLLFVCLNITQFRPNTKHRMNNTQTKYNMYGLILFQFVNEMFILFLYLCFSILLSELLLVKGRNMTLFYLVHFNVVTCEHRLTLKLMNCFAHVVPTDRLGLLL